MPFSPGQDRNPRHSHIPHPFDVIDELCYAGVKAKIKTMDEKYAMQPATKGDVEQVVNKVVDHAVEKLAVMIGNGFAETDKRFAAIETRLGKIENILLEEQRRKIADLENRVKQLEDVIAV